MKKQGATEGHLGERMYPCGCFGSVEMVGLLWPFSLTKLVMPPWTVACNSWQLS